MEEAKHQQPRCFDQPVEAQNQTVYSMKNLLGPQPLQTLTRQKKMMSKKKQDDDDFVFAKSSSSSSANNSWEKDRVQIIALRSQVKFLQTQLGKSHCEMAIAKEEISRLQLEVNRNKRIMQKSKLASKRINQATKQAPPSSSYNRESAEDMDMIRRQTEEDAKIKQFMDTRLAILDAEVKQLRKKVEDMTIQVCGARRPQLISMLKVIAAVGLQKVSVLRVVEDTANNLIKCDALLFLESSRQGHIHTP
jgi:hypothetical protein